MMLLAFQEGIAMSESLFFLTGLPCHYYLALRLERMVLRTEGAASIHHLASQLPMKGFLRHRFSLYPRKPTTQ